MSQSKGLLSSDAENVATSRRDEIVKLRKAGLTYAEIGRRFEITRERVRQILKGNLRPRPPKTTLKSKIMLTPSDVASLLGIHVNTVRRWSNKGVLRSYRISPRGDRRFRREDVDGFLSDASMLMFEQVGSTGALGRVT